MLMLSTRLLVRSDRRRDNSAMRAIAPFRMLADLALPPRCPGCGAVTGEDHRFCATCWQQLRFLGAPACATCNLPFAFDRGAGAHCGNCLAAPPRHDGIRAAVAYGDIARRLALGLKYGGRLGFAETIARQLARLVTPGIDLIIPVPLHPRRLWMRGFNQAAMIARALSRQTDIPCDVASLKRVRATPLLRGLGAKARAAAVANAFLVPSVRAPMLAGKTVALIDDVYTSGATADGCVKALKSAGAHRVIILCWARVLNSERDD